MSIDSPFPQVQIPTSSVYDYLFADIDPAVLDEVALLDTKSNTPTTYREMIGRIDAFAGALAHRGLGPGDVVGLLGGRVGEHPGALVVLQEDRLGVFGLLGG